MRDTLRRVLFTLALLTVIQISSSQVHSNVSMWSTWSPYSSCSCGITWKLRTRIRTCTNYRPALGGTFCSERLFEIESGSCAFVPCPGEDWLSEWSAWSCPHCTATCRGVVGTVTRNRTCIKADNTSIGCTANLTDSETRGFGPSKCPVSPIESGVIGGAIGMALTLLLIGGLATCLLRTGRLTWRSSACTDSADGRHTTDIGDTGQIPAHAHMSGVTSHDYAELNDFTRVRDEMPTYEVIKRKSKLRKTHY
ncbi:semaphorin-5A-like [Haliotis cracherodii]|uniref:semaphorin-5A-like n=1 Tax=Haliotis cracherodii TaxID=6455 RepID=UPI0039EB9058